MMPPVVKFGIVGALGFAVQLFALWWLTTVAAWTWLPATIAAVELAIVHNYLWHRAWTWGDRRGSFARFNASTAMTSITGNVALMAAFAGALGLPIVIANAMAVAVMSAANFLIADRWVFRACASCLVIASAAVPASAAPTPEALSAWRRYVADTEARIARADGGHRMTSPEGATIDVDGGTISHWRGSVFVAGVTVEEVLNRLQHPGTPPPQEDVTASRVLARGTDSLRVSVRLVRRAIVTVTYDTEHEMIFRRETPLLATARSVATRIDEVGGGDKGFLWRLHSYWRYAAVDGGVLVSLESLTLSRDVPLLLRPLAGRIVPRIARESMLRTLEAVRRYLEPHT